MSLLMGCTVVLGAGLIYTGSKLYHFKEKTRRLEETCHRESLYAKIYPIKRVLLRYHKLMEPHEFRDVAHQQARFIGIHGALKSSERLQGMLEKECGDATNKKEVKKLLCHHEAFLKALSERNDVVKGQLQEVPEPSHRPPSPNDLERKMWYLRRSLDEYDGCLYKYNVEKCLVEMREIIEMLRFYEPEVLVKPIVWEALMRNEHFLVELINLLPESRQKGIRTDAAMLQAAG